MKFSLTFAAIVLASGSVYAQSNEQPQIATLNASGVLMKDIDLMSGGSTCQPLSGDRVAILETRHNANGMQGLDAARVQVVSGKCQGETGWVGLARLVSTNQ